VSLKQQVLGDVSCSEVQRKVDAALSWERGGLV